MAYDHPMVHIPGLRAGADLRAKQFHAVKPASTAGEVVPVSDADDDCIGILYNQPGDGAPAAVAAGGILKGVAGGEIAAGKPVAFNSTAQLVQSTADQRQLVGYAVEGASAGDVFAFVWQRSRY
ncbi:MAG: hypothetical protein Kow00120_23720 [Anaerolineae bacterium]